MRRLPTLAISTLLIIGAIVAVVMASGPIKRLAISTYLFKSPETMTSIIAVPAGTPVEVVEQQGQWVKVAITGWVMGSWLRDENQSLTITQAAPSKAPSAVDIGGSISLSGVTFKSALTNMSEVMGEVTNNSGVDIKWLTLRLTVYNSQDQVIASQQILIQNLKANENGSFSEIILVPLSSLARYSIKHESSE